MSQPSKRRSHAVESPTSSAATSTTLAEPRLRKVGPSALTSTLSSVPTVMPLPLLPALLLPALPTSVPAPPEELASPAALPSLPASPAVPAVSFWLPLPADGNGPSLGAGRRAMGASSQAAQHS